MPYSVFQVSRRLYLSLMVVILLVAAGLRLHLLEADAPLELSPTQELALDGPVTIAAGRDRALFGSWDPYPGPLQPYRYYPAMNWLAYVFFSFLGVGYWQAKLISVATGFASIVLVAAFAREHFGRRVSLFSALFMASNYIYVFYNRDPMAYTTVAFGVTLSMYCWGRGLRRPFWFYLSGLVLIFNTLFVKLPGIAFLPAALLGLFVLWREQRQQKLARPYYPVLMFLAGLATMAAIWYLFIYLPHSQVVSQAYYVRTFSPTYTLIDNVRFAVQSFLLFGVDFGFNMRMLLIFSLAYGYLFLRGAHLLSRDRSGWTAAETMVLSLLAGSIVMLFFSGIRPLRFHIPLIPPSCLVAAMALDGWLIHQRLPLPAHFGRLYPVIVLAGTTYLLYQIAAGLLTMYRMARLDAGPVDARVAPTISELYVLLVAGLALAILVTVGFLWRVLQAKRFYLPLPAVKTRHYLAVLLILLVFGGDLFQYWLWARAPQFTIVETSRQIGSEFDIKNTVLAGSYAYTLALENDFPAVWFYGHSPGEAILASSFTHLVVETATPLTDSVTNDQRLRENLPELMARAKRVKTYEVRGYQVSVYEVQ